MKWTKHYGDPPLCLERLGLLEHPEYGNISILFDRKIGAVIIRAENFDNYYSLSIVGQLYQDWLTRNTHETIKIEADTAKQLKVFMSDNYFGEDFNYAVQELLNIESDKR